MLPRCVARTSATDTDRVKRVIACDLPRECVAGDTQTDLARFNRRWTKSGDRDPSRRYAGRRRLDPGPLAAFPACLPDGRNRFLMGSLGSAGSRRLLPRSPRSIGPRHPRARHMGAGRRPRRLGPPRRRGHAGSRLAGPRREGAGGDAGRARTSAGSSPTPAATPRPIASQSGTAATGVRSARRAAQITNGEVYAIAVANGKIYAGGTFTNAGDDNADKLAVWDGSSWKPFCDPTADRRRQRHGAAGHRIDALRRRRSRTGPASRSRLPGRVRSGKRYAERPTVEPGHPFSGVVYALTADEQRQARAGGGSPTSTTSRRPTTSPSVRDGGSWSALGSGGGACGCALELRAQPDDDRHRRLRRHRGNWSAGETPADKVARWSASGWSAVGSEQRRPRTAGSRRRP